INRGQGLHFLLHEHKNKNQEPLINDFKILIEYKGRFFTGTFFYYDESSNELRYPDVLNEKHEGYFNFVNWLSDCGVSKLRSLSCKHPYEKHGNTGMVFEDLSSVELYQAFVEILDEWEKEKDIELSYPPYIYNLKEYGSDKPAIPFVDASDLDFNIVGLLEI